MPAFGLERKSFVFAELFPVANQMVVNPSVLILLKGTGRGTNGRGERVLENPAVQVLGAIFRKMNLDQNTIGAVSERLQNEKEKKDNIVKIIVAVVIIYLICYIIGGEVEWLARTAIIWTGIVLAIRGIRKKN